ncbi:MAG: adenosine kinase [Alphaproteobacteria bacterium]|nr:adenosine kinase [Alphaproteobacteria bacterium]
MAAPSYDVVGIGNAIVDVLARTDDALVQRQGLTKGTMALVDTARAEAIYAAMPAGVEKSGGSAANTVAGIASLGGRGAYIGKVRDDALGTVFAHDLKALGVRFDTKPATSGPPTARCLILVTPDAQRTMCTFLGACVDLGPEDIDEALVASASVTYLEGYLFDPPRAMEAFRKAASVAHKAGRQVSLSLSDPFCVDRHRAEFRDLVAAHVDVLFANEREICSLYETKHFELAAEAVRGHCDVAVLTRSERGSNVVTKTDMLHVAPATVARVIDTTGAGDLYAAGFLYGLTHGRDLATCGRLGSLCAAEIIAHVGARPETSLQRLAVGAGLI